MGNKNLPKCPYVMARNVFGEYVPDPDDKCPVLPHERREAIAHGTQQVGKMASRVADVADVASKLYGGYRLIHNAVVSPATGIPPAPPIPEVFRKPYRM